MRRPHVFREWLATFTLLLCMSRICWATPDSPDDYLIKNWTTGDGLPENTVRAIVETRDGYLWVGTANGLARFDGVRFTRFDSANTPALLSADIFALQEDPQGGLWINTRRGTVRYADGRFETMRRLGDGPQVALRNLAVDTEGHFWMHTTDALVCWNGVRLEPIALPNGPDGIIRLCAAREGGLWLAARNGLWRYRDGSTVKVEVSPVPELLTTSRDGTLWGLVGERRLFALRDGIWSEEADLGSEPCTSLYCAPSGDVWIGSYIGNRAFRFRAGQLVEIDERQGLEGNRAIVFREDREGNLWLGMNGAGLYRLRERRLQLFRRGDGLKNLSLSSICQDATGTVMVNVMGQTLHRFANGRFEPVAVATTGEPYEYPTALMPAQAGGVWAGTFFGSLPRIMQERVVESVGSDSGTRALFIDRDGDLWRGTRTGGVEHFWGTNVTRFTTNEGLSFDNVYCLAQDHSGAIWAGTEEGLNRIEGKRVTCFGKAEGLGHHFISALCVDSRGTVWAGTLGGGLSGWNGSRFVTLTTREGLADDAVQQLLEDDCGQLWIGTRAGLMRVALDHLHEFLAGRLRVIAGTLVGRNEGLPRPDCWTEYQPAGIKARDGRLWFCTSSGVVLIDPQRFATPAPPPIVHIEELTVNGQIVAESHGRPVAITVPAGGQRIEIHYTGLSPSSPELVRFRYRLIGYDHDWVDAGRNRSVNYTHLPPGRYEFHVTAANNDGVWNEAGVTAVLIVEPAVWQTTWFRGLLLVAFLGSGPAFYRWRVRRLEARRAAQETFAHRLIDSQEQERKRIAAELHDSLGQNLLVMKNLATLALTQQNQPDRMAAHLGEVSAMASTAIREVRHIAQNLRPFQLDELGLTQAIATMIRNLEDSSHIHFHTNLSNIDRALPAELEINLYRIVQECLNNVVKHSHAKAVFIHLRREAGGLKLTISDDGQGFDPAAVSRSTEGGFGLSNITERAHALGGKVTFHSGRGEGTRVELVVPAR